MTEISVIIPTYNRSPRIFLRAFNSVIKQTLPPKEIVIVDSGDIEEYSKTIKDIVNCTLIKGVVVNYIKTQKKMNGSEARNLGASYCSGSLYCFLDDDDEWYAEKLELQSSLFTNGIGIISSNYNLDIKEKTFYECCKKRDPNTEILGENCIGCTSMAMISASIFKELNGFDPKFKSNQEWDLWIRVSRIAKIYQDEHIVGIKYNSDFSITTDKIAILTGHIRLLIKHFPEYMKHPHLFVKSSFLLLLRVLN